MKAIFKPVILSAIFLSLLWSCKKDENQVVFLGGTPPVLTASVTDSIPLSNATKNDPAITLTWTNPNYHFSTGISSQDVTYQVQIDTTGSNFTNPQLQTISVSKDLSTTITQGDFNGYLLNQLLLATGVSHNLEIRVKASIANSDGVIYSNVLKLKATPYAIPPAVTPPPSGNLYLVGSATAGGWNNPVPVPSQQFTMIDATHYTITVPLTGGNQYLFLPLNGDWSHKYGNACGSDGCNLATGDAFKAEGNNFTGPAASGTYKIDVDFQHGRFTVTPH